MTSTCSCSIDQAEAVIGGFLLLIFVLQVLKKIHVLRKRLLEDKAAGRLNQYAIPEDPHSHHMERDQIEGQYDGMLALPDDPALIKCLMAQSHALPHDQHQLVDLHQVPWHMINDNN